MRAWQVLVNLFSVVAVELHQIDWIGGPTTQRQYIYAVSVQRLQAHISMPAFFFFFNVGSGAQTQVSIFYKANTF